MYRLSIIDYKVEFPEDMQICFETIDEAHDALTGFVHHYDGKMQVDGRIIDTDTEEDVDYVSSILAAQ